MVLTCKVHRRCRIRRRATTTTTTTTARAQGGASAVARMSRDVAYGADVDVAVVQTANVTRVYYRARADAATDAPPPLLVVRGERRERGECAPWDGLGPGVHAFACDAARGCVFDDANGMPRPTVGTLSTYVREKIFDVFQWSGALDDVRVRGDVELFAPHRGTNCGFHRDGYVAGGYIAHALAKDDVDACGATWFEHALTLSSSMPREMTVESFDVDFENQSRAVCGVRAGNFVPVDARGDALVIFEDAAALHRSPKASVLALEAQTRVIVRFNFSASYISDGRTIRFKHPPESAWRSFDDSCVVGDLAAHVASAGIDEYIRD